MSKIDSDELLKRIDYCILNWIPDAGKRYQPGMKSAFELMKNVVSCMAQEEQKMSMISEQIKQLEKLRDRFFGKGREWYKIINDAIDTIKTLSAKVANENMIRSSQYYHHGWIPCEERLPEEKINPITNDGYVYPVTAKFGDVKDIRYYTFCNGHWHHGAGIVDRHVVAWMPLPEEYKEVEE